MAVEQTAGQDPNSGDQFFYKDGKVRFRASGADREVGEDEARKLLSKAFGADEALREAAKMRTELQAEKEQLSEQVKQAELLGKVLESSDPQAFKDLLVSFGYDEEAAAELLKRVPAMNGQPPSPGAAPAAVIPQSMLKFFQQCDKAGIDPFKAITASRDNWRALGELETKKLINDYLDKHPKFSVLWSSGEQGRKLREQVFDQALQRVQAGGEPLEPATIEKSLGTVQLALDVVLANVQPAGDSLHPATLGGAPGNGGVLLPGWNPPKAPNKDDLSKKDWSRWMQDAVRYAEASKHAAGAVPR